MAYNTTHNVALPNSKGENPGFFITRLPKMRQGALTPTRRMTSSIT